MFAIHFYENNIAVLSQALNRVPEVEENIKIKGRKGKVVEVVQIEDNKYRVNVTLEKINKAPLLIGDKKKKR